MDQREDGPLHPFAFRAVNAPPDEAATDGGEHHRHDLQQIPLVDPPRPILSLTPFLDPSPGEMPPGHLGSTSPREHDDTCGGTATTTTPN